MAQQSSFAHEILNHLLERLASVRRAGRGWVAKCPAHDDKTPSLNIREGEKGLLIKCWTGCSLADICAALGIQPCKLFYDSGLTREQRRARPPRPKRVDWRRTSYEWEYVSDTHWLKADTIFKAAMKLTPSCMTDEELEQAWHCLDVAFRHQRVADHFADMAFAIRRDGLASEAKPHGKRRWRHERH